MTTDAPTPADAPPAPAASSPAPTLPVLALQLAPTDMVDPSRFDDARRQQVASIAASVSATDSNTVATFGAGPQRKLSGFLDQLLAGAKTDDLGLAGALWRSLRPTSRRWTCPP